jgi:hypothetical protein
MANTPYQTTGTLVSASNLTPVVTTTPALSSYGYTQAQATAIITQLNAVIALLQAGGETHIIGG